MHTQTHAHTHIYTYRHKRMHTHRITRAHTQTHAHINTNSCTHRHTHTNSCTHEHMHTQAHTHTLVLTQHSYMHTYNTIYTHTEKHIHSEYPCVHTHPNMPRTCEDTYTVAPPSHAPCELICEGSIQKEALPTSRPSAACRPWLTDSMGGERCRRAQGLLPPLPGLSAPALAWQAAPTL